MKAGTKLTSTTDVRMADRWFAKGSAFVVADKVDTDAVPAAVDAFTADRWLQERWAVLDDASAVKGKAK